MSRVCDQCGRTISGGAFISVWGTFCSPQEWSAGVCRGQTVSKPRKKKKKGLDEDAYRSAARNMYGVSEVPKKGTGAAKKKKKKKKQSKLL
jgi:hypothetical protein